MLLFDYLLTLDKEVSFFWTRRLRVAVPFLLIRILMLMSAFFTFAAEGDVGAIGSSVCSTIHTLEESSANDAL